MFRTSRILAVVIALALASGSVLSLAAGLTPVPAANPKAAGFAAPNVLSPELAEKVVAQGSNPLENPSGQFTLYGYNNDGPPLPSLGSNIEATKTEPDKNTYLVLPQLSGADANYDYGHRFLFQGHTTMVIVSCSRATRTARMETAISPASTSMPTRRIG
jgi:hypothetical protein